MISSTFAPRLAILGLVLAATGCSVSESPQMSNIATDDACDGAPVIDCAAPPPGCNYEGGGCVDGAWTCGTLVCEDTCEDAPIIDCAAPPPGCNYQGGGCFDGAWTCGTLVCER